MIFGRRRVKEAEKMSMKLKADHANLMKQMEELMASMKKKPLASISDTPDFEIRKGRSHIKGQPHGRILHKLIGYTTSYFAECERYVVVQPDLWIAIDSEGDIINHAEDIDPFGQVHWEENCPRTKRPR